MPRIPPIADEEATGRADELLAPLRREGRSLNVYRTLAHAPAALDAYLAIRKALSRGSFTPQLREKLAIAISAANGCVYCVPAHAAGARKLGVPESEIEQATRGHAADAREDAILQLAVAIVTTRGWVVDATIERARNAGVTDGDVMETIAHVAANTLTNYANHVAGTAVDVRT